MIMERPLTEHIKKDNTPLTLSEYQNNGGYQAVRKVVGKMAPAEVTNIVKDSNLKG